MVCLFIQLKPGNKKNKKKALKTKLKPRY